MPLWISALVAFLLSLTGCWLITQLPALRQFASVEPVENRWHQLPTPGLGGIPIYIAFTVVTLLSSTPAPLLIAIFICTLPLLAMGAYDDLKPVKPKLKLATQVGSAILFVVIIASPIAVVGLSIGIIDNNGLSLLHWLLCLFWIVAIINAINLLDNMDGLSAGIAIIACLTIAILLHRNQTFIDLSRLYIILTAALCGFLVLNHNPAKLFMGDAGTLWIGFMVGVGALILTSIKTDQATSQHALAYLSFWLLPIMICAVPISDTLMVVITRKMRKQPISIGGKDHLSHRLVCLGLSERLSVAILWSFALISSLLAVIIHTYTPAVWLAPAGIYCLVLVSCIAWLTYKTSAPNGVAQYNPRIQST